MSFLCCRIESDVKPGSIGKQVESRVRTPCGHGFQRQSAPPIRATPASPPSPRLKDSPVRPLSTVQHHHHLPVNPTTTDFSPLRVSQRIAPFIVRRSDLRPPNHHQDMSSRGGKLAPEVNRCVLHLFIATSSSIVNRQSPNVDHRSPKLRCPQHPFSSS